MSAAAINIEAHAEGYQESLTERLSRAPIPADEAIRHAIRIANSLRDLHTQGLIYGAVSSQLILLAPGGAFLRTSGGLAQLGDGRVDVEAFGVVLRDILRRIEGPRDVLADLDTLSAQCRHENPDMQQVLIPLRLLGLRLRQSSAVRIVAPPAPRRRFALMPTVRRWTQVALAPLSPWIR